VIRDVDLRGQSTSIKTPRRVIAADADESGGEFNHECKIRNTYAPHLSLVEETQRFTALLETFLRENV
jgi:3-oxoadipate enol-lactonase